MPSHWTRARAGLIGAAFIVGSFGLYARAIGIGLLSDDFVLADWAARREFVHLGETGFVRPAVPLLWAALELLPGPLDAAVHAANVALHAVNALLVVIVGRRMRLSGDEAIAAGVFFLAQPALAEAIVWASGAQDVLMTTCGLAAVIAATAGWRSSTAAAIAATVVALAVKETAVVIPVLAALVFWAGGEPVTRGRARRVLVSLAVLIAAYVSMRFVIGLPSTFFAATDFRYLAKQLIVGPFATLGAPWTDHWGRAHLAVALARSLGIIALLAAGFAFWRRRDVQVRQVAAAAAWVVVGVVPAFSFFYVGPDLEGSRYVYLPAAGFALFLGVLAGTVAACKAGLPRPILTAVVIAALALPVLPAIADDIDRWERAAAVRDEVLSAAERSAAVARCGTFRMEGGADHVRGAFVLRNGLAQALARRGAQLPGAEPPRGPLCTISWSDGRFTVE